MQNFGKIKNTFNEILAESIVSGKNESKLLFKKYLKAIKESKILKTQFLVYDNIENKISDDVLNINIFVTENIKLLEQFKPSDILNENQKLLNLLKETEVKFDEDYGVKKQLHESISKLVFTKKTPNNINDITDNINRIISYIKENKLVETQKPIELPINMLTAVIVDKFNEKYSTLDEIEQKVLKTLIKSNDEEKKEIYSTTLRECITLIDSVLVDSDLETKDKLLRVKDKLLNDKIEINENFNTSISKLVELRSNLQNNQ